jgi:hypothetical protein
MRKTLVAIMTRPLTISFILLSLFLDGQINGVLYIDSTGINTQKICAKLDLRTSKSFRFDLYSQKGDHWSGHQSIYGTYQINLDTLLLSDSVFVRDNLHDNNFTVRHSFFLLQDTNKLYYLQTKFENSDLYLRKLKIDRNLPDTENIQIPIFKPCSYLTRQK